MARQRSTTGRRGATARRSENTNINNLGARDRREQTAGRAVKRLSNVHGSQKALRARVEVHGSHKALRVRVDQHPFRQPVETRCCWYQSGPDRWGLGRVRTARVRPLTRKGLEQTRAGKRALSTAVSQAPGENPPPQSCRAAGFRSVQNGSPEQTPVTDAPGEPPTATGTEDSQRPPKTLSGL